MTVVERIRERLPALTKKQREVACYMLEDPSRMSYVTLKGMSQELDITEMTILKTCTLLGFSGFSNMKYEFRRYAATQLEQFRVQNAASQVSSVSPAERMDPQLLVRKWCDDEIRLVRGFLEQIDPQALFQAADRILAADKVLLYGRGISLYVCQYAANLMSSLGQGAVPVNTELYDDVYGTLPLIDEKTLVIPVAFPDYYTTTIKVAQVARQQGAQVLGITDNERSPLLPHCDSCLFCPTQSHVFLNNVSMAMELVNLLASVMCLRCDFGSGQQEPADPFDRYRDWGI